MSAPTNSLYFFHRQQATSSETGHVCRMQQSDLMSRHLAQVVAQCLPIRKSLSLIPMSCESLLDVFAEFQWRLEWLKEADQSAYLIRANNLWQEQKRPPCEKFYQEYFKEDEWMAEVDSYHAVWHTVVFMICPNIQIGCNWRKTSGRRAEVIASTGIWYGLEVAEENFVRVMWCYARVAYLLAKMVGEYGLCADGSEITCLKLLEE